MIYRLKQFIWSIIYSFKKIDKKYIDVYLNEEEKNIFKNLKKSEQHHSIRVSKEALQLLKNKKYIQLEEKEVGKVGLLHDVGKIRYPINLIEKSLLVILSKITNNKIKKLSKIKCVDIYYNHPIYSIEVLNIIKLNYNKNFKDAIRYHHCNNISSNELLNILREADNKC